MNNNLKDVCKIGQGAACCKFLLCGSNGFECAKAEGWEFEILEKWNSTKVAQGDNCSGLEKEELNKK